MLDIAKPPILIDTREPDPHPWEPHFSSTTIRGTIPTGDFSLCGCEHLVAIERKTTADLIACLCSGRDRFERELARAQSIPHFWVIIEGSYRDILQGNYRSQMTPEAAFQSIVALMTRYRIPFLMATDVPTAARLCESLLLKWLREHVKAVEKAVRETRLAERLQDSVRVREGLREAPARVAAGF